jgi:hypothetical protein
MSDATSSAFPQRKLTKILWKPSNTPHHVLKRQLYNNAASIPSRRNGGAHGHLSIVLDTSWHLGVSGYIPWVTPKHPGNSPNLALVTTAIQHKQVTCQYTSDLVAFEPYNKTYYALKQQLL